jgi:biopolymer transport protein ExbD
MKQSRRAQRMARHHKRNSRIPSMNLVSLMDIFTILVFFLLVNSSDGEVLPSTRNVTLPESISKHKPRQNVVVMVTDSDVLVQGHRVAKLQDVRDDVDVIGTLKTALEEQLQRQALPTAGDRRPPQEVTIMGNKHIPYSLLKKVMTSCTEAGYARISLAVLQKAIDQES